MRTYRKKHKIRLAEGRRERYAKNRDKMALKRRIYREKNIEKSRAYDRAYREAHPEQIKATQARHAASQKRKDSLKIWNRRRDVMDKRNAHHRAYFKKNPNAKIAMRLRNRLFIALRGIRKSKSAINLLGCSLDDFKIYLESRFEVGMSWENWSKTGWHIDHIIPCAIFDLSKPEHQKRCFHFSNMQPMWASENQSKYSNVTTKQFSLL